MIAIGWIVLVLTVINFLVNVGASIAGYEVKFEEKDEDHSIGSVIGTMIALGIKVMVIWWIFQMVTSL